jgi:hypothetical protein
VDLTEFDKLFDPERSPLLQPGYVSPQWRATPADLETARVKLATRAWRWSSLGDGERAAALAGLPLLVEKFGQEVERATDAARALLTGAGPAAFKRLPFYEGGLLVHVEGEVEGRAGRFAMRLVVATGRATYPLTSVAGIIHRLNTDLPVRLSAANVEDYLVFFCEHVHGDEGGFYIIEEAPGDERPLPDGLTLRNCDERVGQGVRAHLPGIDRFETLPRAEIPMPVTLLPARDGGGWPMLATVIYGGEAFRAAFVVRETGEVEMAQDELLDGCALRPLDLRWTPGATRELLGRRDP